MLLNAAAGNWFVKAKTALVLARLVLRDHYGEAALRLHSPLRVEDGGDRWKITGRDRRHPKSGDGDFEMEVMKFDGQIHNIFMTSLLPRAPEN